MATRLTSNQKILGSTPSVSAIFLLKIRDSLMVRMGACRVPDRGSIPRRGDFFIFLKFLYVEVLSSTPGLRKVPRGIPLIEVTHLIYPLNYLILIS